MNETIDGTPEPHPPQGGPKNVECLNCRGGLNALPFVRAENNHCVLCDYDFVSEQGERLKVWDVLALKLTELRRLIQLYKMQLNLNDPMRSMTLDRIHGAVSVLRQLDR